MQPFGYTGYRYDAVVETYFAQAREYVPGVGRFAGEDWIKGSISYPTSLNAYGYCYGNPMAWVDRDGKEATGAYSLDVKESPYVGVMYINAKDEGFKCGHVAIMLIHKNNTGDLYSFGGQRSATAIKGYNDAYVNCGYGLDLDSKLNVKKEKYEFTVNNRSKSTNSEFYNRGIFIPIDNEQGKAIVKSVESTKLEVNGFGNDIRDYNVLLNNCDIKSLEWLKAGGIDLIRDVTPNGTYNATVDYINKGLIKREGMIYGNLYDIWKNKNTCLSNE